MFRKRKSAPRWLLDDESYSPPIISIKTSKFDNSVEFYRILGFEVKEPKGDQLCPLFTQQRGARIAFGPYILNLEEDNDTPSSPVFNLFAVEDLPEEQLATISEALGQKNIGESLYGRFYTFTSPDGGEVVIASKQQPRLEHGCEQAAPSKTESRAG